MRSWFSVFPEPSTAIHSQILAVDQASRRNSSASGSVLPCTYRVIHEGNTMSEATFTFRVDEALKAEFSNAARNRDRNAAQLLRDFMRDFVRQQQEASEHDAWFRRQVQIGLDSANVGQLIPADEVEAKFAAKRTATRRRLEAAAE